MHEVSIASGILDIAVSRCLESGCSRIEAVNARIGRASGVMPDALLFAFDVMKTDTIAKDAVLNITEVPVSGRCGDCGGAFETSGEYVLECPLCGGASFSIISGSEMDIIDIEVS